MTFPATWTVGDTGEFVVNEPKEQELMYEQRPFRILGHVYGWCSHGDEKQVSDYS